MRDMLEFGRKSGGVFVRVYTKCLHATKVDGYRGLTLLVPGQIVALRSVTRGIDRAVAGDYGR